MKTIRWKFMSMFIVVTAAVMILVLVLFNIAIRIYFENSAKRELKNTFSTMDVLIEKQLLRGVVGGNGSGEDALLSLSSALTASRLTGNEFLVYDRDYALKFPEDAQGAALSGMLGDSVQKYDYGRKGEIKKIATTGGTYFIAGMQFEGLQSGRLYIVFVSGMADKNELIGVMNILLIAIMLVSLGGGIFYAIASARSLTRPIQKVCDFAREIGGGNFITIPPDDSSLETRALIDSINEMSGRLKSADQAQKSFLQNASHELRTPLMSIRGYSEAIEKGIGYDPKEAASIIRSESIRLTTLVEELITLSKIDNNIYGSQFQRLDLNEAITDCVDRLNGLALREDKKITPALTPGIAVRADDGLLTQALGNVVSNCLRYAKTEVVIRLAVQNTEAVVTVSDDGDGFDPAELPHIFERFYKGKGGKFGLGLAIALKSLDLMGGTIEAQNGEKGAEFTIRLPLDRG